MILDTNTLDDQIPLGPRSPVEAMLPGCYIAKQKNIMDLLFALSTSSLGTGANGSSNSSRGYGEHCVVINNKVAALLTLLPTSISDFARMTDLVRGGAYC